MFIYSYPDMIPLVINRIDPFRQYAKDYESLPEGPNPNTFSPG
ncbi:hypothetical protein JMUB7504_27060 [Staphylococcus aureus]